MVCEGFIWPSIDETTLIIPHELTKKESDTSNNKVYECQTKDDISWQFICVSLLAIPKNWLQTILCRSCIFSFHYPFNFLTRMSNATNSNKYAWQFHFVFCYVFFYILSCDNNNCNNNIFLSHWYIISITVCFPKNHFKNEMYLI